MSGLPSARRHILTVNAEEYFHGGALSNALSRKHWDRLESRLERNIDEVLAILDAHRATATFFVMGWSAERNPRVVRRIVGAGHEVASRGFWPRGVAGMVPEEFRDDLRRTREALLAAGAVRVQGFRSPRWLCERDLWVLDVLAEEGYRYDSSINPLLRRFAHDPRLRTLHEHRHSKSNLSLWEVPISTASAFGVRYGISGGNYLRQLPAWFMRRQVTRWQREHGAPLVFYFTPWEFDAEQPQISTVSPVNRVRQYRNLGRAREVFEDYFARLEFCSIAQFLERRKVPRESPADVAPALPERIVVGAAAASPLVAAAADAAGPAQVAEAAANAGARPEPVVGPGRRVSLVVPLFNEEATVSYLRRTLEGLRARARGVCEFDVVLVDDRSTDNTIEEIQRAFADWPGVRLISHDRNRGVAAAIMTGIRASTNEIVCSMDCDCSYDPAELLGMLPLIEGAELVTASPYHPQGSVHQVPAWRLLLSHNLSRLYNLALRESLYTYTSCFRVVRRTALAGLQLEHDGFLGVAEMLIRLRLSGGRVREYPTVLESRVLGVSKMKTLRTVRQHLGLLSKVVTGRSGLKRGARIPAPASAPTLPGASERTLVRAPSPGAPPKLAVGVLAGELPLAGRRAP